MTVVFGKMNKNHTTYITKAFVGVLLKLWYSLQNIPMTNLSHEIAPKKTRTHTTVNYEEIVPYYLYALFTKYLWANLGRGSTI